MSDEPKLAPCPFCGGEASAEGYQQWRAAPADMKWGNGDPIEEAYFCNCPSCGVANTVSGVGHQTRADAIAAWNRRVPAPAVPDDVAEPSDEVKDYLDGVIGVVEANSYESMCLWQKYTGRKETWVSTGSGYGPIVGQVRGAPVCISLLTATVKGHKIAFIEPTSRVVDWNIIDLWLEKALPKTAFNEKGYVNETNAMNFHNIFLRAALTHPKEPTA